MDITLFLAQIDSISKNVELWKLVIGWCFVGIIVCTAIITLIALVKPDIIPEKDVRNKLYWAFLIEIMVAAVGMFTNLIKVDTNAEKAKIENGEKVLVTQADQAHSVATDATAALADAGRKTEILKGHANSPEVKVSLGTLTEDINKKVNHIQNRLPEKNREEVMAILKSGVGEK